MFARPTIDDVVEAARGLGIRIAPDEAQLYCDGVTAGLARFDGFVQDQDSCPPPPRFPGAREPGRRPSSDEDPHHAWLWKCRIEGEASGPLAGKSVSFKDNTAVAGLPLTFGSFVLDGYIPDFDATIVRRVLECGGTIIGKNSTNGFVGGYGFGGLVGDYPRPTNPHNPEHVPGASSSGSAIAVATGDVDVSFGGDQGGSVRIPAAWCGTVGLKPTFGLVSQFGTGFATDPGLDHLGPLTRTVQNAAAALDAVVGFDPLDHRQSPDRPVINASDGLAEGIKGLRVGVLVEGLADADSDVRDVVLTAVDVLAAAGAHVRDVSVAAHRECALPFAALATEGAYAIFRTSFFGAFTPGYYPEGMTAAINRMWTTQADLLSPRTKLSHLLAEFSRRNFHGRVYARAQNMRPALMRAYDQALTDVDILVMPTCPHTAPRFNEPSDPHTTVARSLDSPPPHYLANTLPFNLTGHPALAMPCGKSGGLPVSMQLVGRRNEDAHLLRAGYAYQESVDWTTIGGSPLTEPVSS